MRSMVVLATVATVIGIQQSSAADLPPRPYERPTAVAVPYIAPFSWSGVYLGLNAGAALGQYSDDFGNSVKATGFLGGGQAGAQMQMGQVVVGIEGDFQATSQNHSANFLVFGVPVTERETMPMFGTLRGRVGYAFDRVMIYGTGGAAWVDGKVEATAGGFTVSAEASNLGWTAGGGVEWAFADHWSTKVEYLYLSSSGIHFSTAAGSFNANLQDGIVRVGLNYRF